MVLWIYLLSFNSIKVRLKRFNPWKKVDVPSFQFHKGTIKTS